MIGHNLANYTCPIDGTATAVGWTQTDLLKNKVGRPCLGFNLALLFPKKIVSHREGNNAEPNSEDGRLDFRGFLRSAERWLIFMISG